MTPATKSSGPQSTALAVVDLNQYPVLAAGSEAAAVLQANLQGESLSLSDLDRIKVPSGGGRMWTVPSIDGEESVSTLEGIIVHIGRRRAYWASKNPSGDPPDCSSVDCITGIGTPGGECASCPLNQFGSAIRPNGAKGRGKACKETRVVFLLRPGSALPVAVVAPPGSLKSLKQYGLKLPVPYFACVTALSLSKEKNKDGIEFSMIVPKYVGPIPVDQRAAVQKYAEILGRLFASAKPEVDDFAGDED